MILSVAAVPANASAETGLGCGWRGELSVAAKPSDYFLGASRV
jgi:hypothetical protein